MQRFLILVLFVFSSFVTASAWSAVTASPNPSTTGNFTVSWPATNGATYKVTQSVNGSSSQVYSGMSTQLSRSGLSNGSYQYTVIAELNGPFGIIPASLGSVTVSVSIAPSPPVVTIGWDSAEILAGQSAILTWLSPTADSCSLEGSNVNVSGTQPVPHYLAGQFTQTIICTNTGGSTSASATINVTAAETEFPVTDDPANDLATGEDFMGYLSGSFSVGASGNANYSIPIAVPPGIGGMQPNLAINYSSDAMNGLLGWGWNISGLSSINRCRADLARDGYLSGISTGDNYRYCLDGERLVHVAGNEYRTESESFRRVTKTGGAWEVVTPDGSIRYYGSVNAANSASLDATNTPITWLVDRYSDVSGNYLDYIYVSDESGAGKRIEKIVYTKNDDASQSANNVIEFIYEARPDISERYIASTLFKSDERLSRVEAKVNGNIVYAYLLNYEIQNGVSVADPAQISRINSITKCFSGTVICSTEVSFDWTSTSIESYILDESDEAYIVGEDISASHYFDENTTVEEAFGGDPFLPYKNPESIAGLHTLENNGVRGDFDGDGKNELIWIDCGGEKIVGSLSVCDRKISMSGSDAGTTFVTLPVYEIVESIYSSSSGGGTTGSFRFLRGRVMDINNDGLDDYYIDGLTSFNVYLSNGSTLVHSPTYSKGLEQLGIIYGTACCVSGRRITQHWTYAMYLIDVNGDRLPDLIRVPMWHSGNQITISDVGVDDISVALNGIDVQGNQAFGSFTQWGLSTDYSFLDFALGGWSNYRFVDVTGDGLADMVGFNGEVGRNTGSAFSPEPEWSANIAMPAVAINGDITVNVYSMGIDMTLATSGSCGSLCGTYAINGYDDRARILPKFLFNPLGVSSHIADVNGDGLFDIVSLRDAGIYVALSNGSSFGTAQLWSNAFQLNDIAPFCNMMECNTQRRRLYVEDINKDGLADVVFTEAWFRLEKQDASNISVIFSKGYFDGQSGFSEPVVVASTETPNINIANLSSNPDGYPRIGKPVLTDDGEFVLHFQPAFMDSENGVSFSAQMNKMYDTAVDVGIKRHKVIGINEGNIRELLVKYDKLSNSSVYTQSFSEVGGRLYSGNQLASTYHAVNQSGQYDSLPDSSFPAAFWGREVVAQLDITLLGQNSEQQNYHYFNQKQSRSGLGSLGFEKLEKTITLAGQTQKLRTVEEFYQEVAEDDSYVLVAPKHTVQCVVNNENSRGCDAADVTIISDKLQNWKVRTYNSGVPHYFPYMLNEQTLNYDLTTGELVSTISKRMFDDSIRSSCPTFTELALSDRTTTTDDHFDAYGTPLNIVESRCDSFGVTGTHTVNDNILNDTVNWCLNQTQDPKIHTWVYSIGTSTERNSTRHTHFSFHLSGDDKCRINTEIREPDGGSELWLQKAYGYNKYGTQDSLTETVQEFTGDGIDFLSRKTSLSETYNVNGQRTIVTTNALGHVKSEIFNAEFGSLDSVTDANGLDFDFDYDALGRLTYSDSLGVATRYDYRSCDNCFAYNSTASWYGQTKIEGHSATRSYFDGLDREVGSRWHGLNGTEYFTGQKYDALGLLEYLTEPFSDSALVHETQSHYDILGRIIKTDFPTGVSQTVRYTVLHEAAAVITTDTALNTIEQRFDALGREKTIKDALGTVVRYWHDAQGNVTVINVGEAAYKIEHEILFDLLGRKTDLIDPDIGTIKYSYNAFGHLTEQFNSASERICYSYDKLDRQVTRRDSFTTSCADGQLHTWTYDENGLGLLTRVEGFDTKNRAQNTEYGYTDDYLLPKTVSQLINGETFEVENYYDDFNRPTGFKYPTGFVIEQKYNIYGLAHQSVNAATEEVLWQANSDDARGNVTDLAYFNGASVHSVFKSETGLIESRYASIGGTILQDHLYSFDNEGNLRSRQDRRVSITQRFCYDSLYRLTDQVINSSCADVIGDSYGGSAYAYDVHGNITKKDGITDYDYTGSGGPHAVSFANGGAYLYDSAGRMTGSPGDKIIDYSVFGKPTYMGFASGYQTEVIYGALQTRVQRGDVEDGELTSTVYVDKHYERITTPDGVVEHRHYLADWGVHVITQNSSDDEDYNVYFTKDHIGSMASKSDDRSGQTIRFHANEPWGRRQDKTWAGVTYDTLSGDVLKEMTFGTSRGFTDHEHLDGVGLIHMNGRVYDPVIGRFVSPDPWIQDPENSQSFNRYSYVVNNPLRYTDPTGEMFEVGYTLNQGALNTLSNPTAGEMAVFSTALDFTPVVGDIKGFAEAIADPTASNIIAAIVGLVPFVGDLVSKAIKNGDKVSEAAGAVKDVLKNSDSSKNVDSLNAAPDVNSSGRTPDSGTQPSGKFTSKQTGDGGEVHVSNDAITQDDFAGIVDGAGNQNVTVLTGTHGTPNGNLVPEKSFFDEDVARWADNPNVDVKDVTGMKSSDVKNLINDDNITVCAWCFSEKTTFD